MNIVAVGSAKGSPGATTTTLALAYWWNDPCIVIEADAAGGDIAARCGMPEEPGLVGMAAGLRRIPQSGRSPDTWITDHVQEITAGIRVLVAPTGSHQTGAALDLISTSNPSLSSVGTDLLIDVGRDSDLRASASWIDGNSSDLFVWACRPVLADLAHLAAKLDRHQPDGRNHVVVLCGTGPYPADEVATTLDVVVIGRLPNDPQGAAALWSGGGRKWVRSALGRASRSLFDAVHAAIASEADVRHVVSNPPLDASMSAEQVLPEPRANAHE
jgi:hypothetical protein